MKNGDRVIHKLTGQLMTIKRVSGSIATLVKDVPEPYKFRGIEYPGYVAVCALKNLQKIDNGTNNDKNLHERTTQTIEGRGKRSKSKNKL